METGLPILDAIEADKALEQSLKRVKDNNSDWMNLALIELEEIAKSPEAWANTEYGFTGEWIRVLLIPHVGPPRHSNAWGALIREAIKSEIIEPTGKWVPMLDVRSHRRKTPQYVFVGEKQ